MRSPAALAVILALAATPGRTQEARQPFSSARAIVQYRLQAPEAPLAYAPQQDPPPAANPTPVAVSNSDLDCMARALAFEAIGVDFDSLLAVGTVIANRASAHSRRWPSTWCGVVGQAKQFSSHPLERSTDAETYNYAMTVARALQSGLLHPGLAGVTEFRTAGAPAPIGMTLVGTYGGNSFYR